VDLTGGDVKRFTREDFLRIVLLVIVIQNPLQDIDSLFLIYMILLGQAVTGGNVEEFSNIILSLRPKDLKAPGLYNLPLFNFH
jgi:hypothetical protein